ncbi:uncharacterized protein I303_106892 [Kwoniella dejecticola CBS 10117]|uniref:Zn(2)-C6 fungal-type domain-containing protein n=1 Tax=Kwoniella dejecticola CBS 10117 TaxID=1296121 RepID=A0A1A5ZTE9_9TREE|nr:uncharacterized protein I303_08469 [Kwoniella dejecticola CBS 10117]OBR81087.1 hypothetical protein I303_08469 [Kwoniella dejecticola CBS 10117]
MRQTQRAPLSCSACSKRRVKCSKTIPCEQCLTRGVGRECKREIVKVGGKIVNRPSEVRLRSRDELELEIVTLRRRVTELESRTSTSSPSSIQGRLVSKAMNQEEGEEGAGSSGNSKKLEFLIKSVELLWIGTTPQPQNNLTPASSALPSFSYPHSMSDPVQYLQNLLPPKQVTAALLQVAHGNVWWQHCSYHIPSLDRQMKDFWEGRHGLVSWGWAALLMSILTTSIHYCDDDTAVSLGLTAGEAVSIRPPPRASSQLISDLAQMTTLPMLWCRATLYCLSCADYLVTPTLVSVQALAILLWVSHVVNTHTLHSTTVSTGIRLAQALGLQDLGQEQVCSIASPDTVCPLHCVIGPHIQVTAEMVQRESARNAWQVLFISECLSWSARDFDGLPRPGDSLPLNINNDYDVGDVVSVHPTGKVTSVSHHLAMHDLAMTMWIYLTSKTPTLQSLAIAEQSLQALLERPALQGNELPHSSWSRHVWITSVHNRRLVINRPFFAKSFGTDRYIEQRRICVDAAHRILDERKIVYPTFYERIWSITFHSLSAGVVLLLEYFDSPPSQTTVSDMTRRDRIYDLIGALNRDIGGHPFVKRASNLLLGLLADEANIRPTLRNQEGSVNLEIPNQVPIISNNKCDLSNQLTSINEVDQSVITDLDPDVMVSAGPMISDDLLSQWLAELQQEYGSEVTC